MAAMMPGPTADASRRRLLAALPAVPVAFAVLSGPIVAQPVEPIRVLMVTATAGYYHDSIPTAVQVLERLSAQQGDFSVNLLGSVGVLGWLNAATLAEHDVLIFANTSGELPLDEAQKQAILDFVAGGKGFVGTHSATDTFYQWAGYGELIGAYFKEHPWVQAVDVQVENGQHPANQGLGDSFRIEEEIYTFRANPRPGVDVLLRLDERSAGASGDYPLAWAKSYGTGRVYYNALGHFSATWEDSRFHSQLLGAIRWAAGRA
jgi:type 1 glutamine amidotransferase